MTTAAPPRALGRKQGIRAQEDWQRAVTASRQSWPDDRLDALIDKTVTEIQAVTAGKRAAYAWSGGKDSLALQYVAELAGLTECVLAISELEYPAMLRWVTEHMPQGLTVISTGQNLRWLEKNPHMLFPQGAYGPRWFTIVNHRGQARYYKTHRLDLLLLGRRRADGNYVGDRGNLYRNSHGIVRYSPLADWPHEAVFSLIERERISLPPCYGWPRGYQVGTGSWPARQWTDSHDHGWSEVHSIDPAVVAEAATVLPEAADWLARNT